MRVGAGLLMALALALPPDATAQGAGVVHRLEVSGAAGMLTGAELGRIDANLRANSPTPQPSVLFTTQSRLAGAWLGEARVGVALTRRIGLEAGLGYSRPQLRTSVSADAEGAPPVTVVERIDQYVVGAGIVVRIDEVRAGGLVPYAAGGAGYLRQLHEGLTVIEEGHVYHLGGGVKRDLVTRDHGIVRAAGLRADARVYFLSGGISPGGGIATQGAFSAGVFVHF